MTEHPGTCTVATFSHKSIASLVVCVSPSFEQRTDRCRICAIPPCSSSSAGEQERPASPTSPSTSRLALTPSSTNSSVNASIREKRMSDFGNYRRDLASIEPYGARNQPGGGTSNFHPTGALGQIAPWAMERSGSAASAGVPGHFATSFYNDSSDNLSQGSQLSPGLRSLNVRSGQTPATSTDSHETAYFNDDRRPSLASITTTASSTNSKASGSRGGIRKLQGFFGEEFPGKDSSETSLPTAGKDHRSHSLQHGRSGRDRNHSNATSTLEHAREASPAPSRPRTPVPAPDVVPFLYQEAEVRLLRSYVAHASLSPMFPSRNGTISLCRAKRPPLLTACRTLRASAKLRFEIR